MTRPLLIEPGAPLVFAAGHELEMMRPDARSKPAGVVRLMPWRDRPAVVDLPGHVVAAADLLANTHDRVTVFVESALVAPATRRRLDAIADEFFPEGHSIPPLLEKSDNAWCILWTFFLYNYIR